METNLIPLDYSRCVNRKCELKNSCKRFMQLELDLKNKNRSYFPISNFDEKDCKNFIKN